MAKTRRQRREEHPNLPKPGVRDPRRKKDKGNPWAKELGRLGGLAYHSKPYGFGALSEEERRIAALKGVEAKRKKKEKEKLMLEVI
jgi:hypothetical protein